MDPPPPLGTSWTPSATLENYSLPLKLNNLTLVKYKNEE